MDVSEQYIKMCDCPEIQKVWGATSQERQDFFQQGVHGYEVWLPRQDQLQEMVLSDFVQQEGGYLPTYWLLHKFEHWLPDYRYANTSMEQLWLAFYMSEKFSKKWDGDKWIALIATQTLKG